MTPSSPHRPPARLAVAVAVAAISLGAAALLAACTSSGGSDSPASSDAPSAPGASGSTTGSTAGTGTSGGTLTFAVGSDTGCVDPQQVGSNDTIYSLRQVVDSLTDQDPGTGEIVPWLAESWDVNADSSQFTFHLRKGVTFSDGTPLDAQAVKADFDAVPKLGALATLATGYLTGATTTVVDPQTVKVSFPSSNAQFLQATSTFSLGIVSPASSKLSPQDRCAKGVVASGPFTLQSYTPNQQIVLAKRTGYDWGSSLFTKPGEAYLDKLVFKVVPEAGVRTGSLTSGQVDAIGSVGRADEAALKAAGINLQARANPGVVFNLGLNNSRFPDVKVRQAIEKAINRQQIATTVFPTDTRPATSVLSHTTPGYTDESTTLAYDAAGAKALLDADGWTVGGDGIREKDGKKLSLTIKWFANAATNQPSLELIQQDLKAVGIDAKLQELQIAQVAQVQQSGDFDALWGNITRADGDILRSSYSTTLANAYRLSPGPLDDVLAKQAAEADPDKRNALLKQAQDLIVQNAYVVPVVELQTELGVAKKVHDLAFEASSRIQLHDTWIG